MEILNTDQNIETELHEDEFQIVSFMLDKEEFGIDILNVHEIIRMGPITKVPKVPSFVEGVVNLRGNVIPIIDLRKRFNFSSKEVSKETRIIITQIQEDNIIGFMVDSVQEVLRLSSKMISPAPERQGKIDSDFISGIGKLDSRLVVLLALEKILSPIEKNMLNRI